MEVTPGTVAMPSLDKRGNRRSSFWQRNLTGFATYRDFANPVV
jgi:hypothetical protein